MLLFVIRGECYRKTVVVGVSVYVVCKCLGHGMTEFLEALVLRLDVHDCVCRCIVISVEKN